MAALAPRLKGLNITIDLLQVGKIVTGQQLQHHGQGLGATFIVLRAAFEFLWFRSFEPPTPIFRFAN